MQARFRKSSKCGCTVEEIVFLFALYHYWSQHVQRQNLGSH
jgi:hypothetical protein